MEFDTYYLVILQRGPRAAEFTPDELDSLQQQHLAYLSHLRESGQTVAAGPFAVAPDYPQRGLILFPGFLGREQVESLANADPSVQAGRLTVEVLEWLTPEGQLRPAE